MSERRKRILGGWFFALVGVLTAGMVYRHLEQLNAPAWVAYAACGAFVFFGLTVVAFESGLHRTHTWLAVAATSALLAPGAWVTFGPGPRACTVSLPFISSTASEWLCRGAFGLGALIVAVLLVWVVLRALRRDNAGQPRAGIDLR